MPLKNYGVLKCRAMDSKLGMGRNPHYQVRVTDDELSHRIAINVKSKLSPSELLYFVNDNFQHVLTEGLSNLDFGFHELERKPGGLALDYIRGNFFDPKQMKALPYNVPGPDNDLNELVDKYVSRAIATEDAILYAFGEKWGPENIADRYFGFRPGNGIHDIHMNQGSVGQFQKDNGVWQDGGLLIHFPSENQWVAVFLAFQSQAFHTDDIHGNRLDVPSPPDVEVPHRDGIVRIVAALVNPPGDDVGKESVTLINTSPERIDLNGWALADQMKRKRSLDGFSLAPGGLVTVPLSGADIQLSNKGGIVTLLDKEGIKIDGVSYTKEDANKQGWTIVF
ncbi:MAG TPA: DUF2278 domain-containing protein [Cyanobacteria bacterium UBA8803]|nr:DUF2278 domain-containing protein [Cyanobacteria bacterium UBA9273]HBL57888.1 DUF2278 domain-containing protein [Cyanobacteria bacterium UBA8803]